MQWEYIPLNPAPGIKPPKSAPGRVWYLQPTELRAALEAAPICGYGYARGEILRLRWLDIDCKAGRVLLPQTKNGGGRIVYLNRLALQAIESVRGNGPKGGDLLFPSVRHAWVSVAFSRVCRSLKIVDFHFHDLRHTAASWLRMKSADIHSCAVARA